VVQSQPRQIICETLSRKNPSQKRTGGVVQGVGPEFKPQYCKKKKIAVNESVFEFFLQFNLHNTAQILK
jgi:hypothetical protein